MNFGYRRLRVSLVALVVKNLCANAGDIGLIPGREDFPSLLSFRATPEGKQPSISD